MDLVVNGLFNRQTLFCPERRHYDKPKHTSSHREEQDALEQMLAFTYHYKISLGIHEETEDTDKKICGKF